MEVFVNLPSRVKVKAIGIWGDNLRDFKKAFSSRGQFPRGKVDLQVVRI